jgi:hypothetical protein
LQEKKNKLAFECGDSDGSNAKLPYAKVAGDAKADGAPVVGPEAKTEDNIEIDPKILEEIEKKRQEESRQDAQDLIENSRGLAFDCGDSDDSQTKVKKNLREENVKQAYEDQKLLAENADELMMDMGDGSDAGGDNSEDLARSEAVKKRQKEAEEADAEGYGDDIEKMIENQIKKDEEDRKVREKIELERLAEAEEDEKALEENRNKLAFECGDSDSDNEVQQRIREERVAEHYEDEKAL